MPTFDFCYRDGKDISVFGADGDTMREAWEEACRTHLTDEDYMRAGFRACRFRRLPLAKHRVRRYRAALTDVHTHPHSAAANGWRWRLPRV